MTCRSTFEFGHLAMRGHGADGDRAALELEALHVFDLGQVDQDLGARQPELHHRDQRMPAGEKLCVFMLAQQADRLADRCRTFECETVHGLLYAAAARGRLELPQRAPHGKRRRRHVDSSVPSALVMAFITAAGAAMAPASPQPLMPSGFDGHLVTVMPTLKVGKFSARGIV